MLHKSRSYNKQSGEENESTCALRHVVHVHVHVYDRCSWPDRSKVQTNL